MAEGLWWRHTWMEAVYGSDLKPLERLVAVVYADHARDKRQVWVTLPRLMERSGLSRDAANRALRGLREKGWLLVFQEAKQHRATIYGLVIPESSSTPDVPLSSTGDGPLEESSSTPPDTSSTRDDTSSTPRVPNQSTYQNSHHTLSPEQALVKDLLGLDDGDERLMKVPQYLQDHTPRNAKAWLRGHKKDELRDNLSELVSGKEETGFAPETDDDKFMDNPHYIEAYGNAQRVRVEDFYRHKIGDLGFLHFEIEDMLKETQRNTSATTAKEVWEDVLQRAHRDVEDHPRCDECSVRIDEGHGRRCSQRERRYCESCGAEAHISHFSGLFPCPKCKRKHQPMQQTA